MKKIVKICRVFFTVFILLSLFFALPVKDTWSSEIVTKQVTLKIDGMSCASCAPTVKKALKRLSGVINAEVSYEKAEAAVSYQEGKVKVEQMIKAIEDVGYKAYMVTGEKGHE